MTARRRLAWIVVAVALGVAVVLALVAAALAALPVAIAVASLVFALVVGLRYRGHAWARQLWPRRVQDVRWDVVEPPALDGPSWTTAWDAPPLPSDLPDTRAQATTVLTEWDVEGEDAEPILLVLNELLTNAVEHARPPLHLTLRLGEDFVRVEVHDTAVEPPCFRPRGAEGGGHGVQLVAALAARHGWSPGPGGKTVWADVPAGWP